ncbi:MAG: alginate O-acetyltransferase complex protein AlgI [Candidatus Azotimanducaceae bacterium]|jgi:alginate O-acetyltransferase complex protein AlgI
MFFPSVFILVKISNWLGFSSRENVFVLLLCSIYFYANWNYNYLALLLFSIFVNYSIAILLLKSECQVKRRKMLRIGILTNLLLLGYFKYAGFLSDNLSLLLPAEYSFEVSVILPLAISFFTLQQITFLVEQAKNPKPVNLYEYSLFVTFFPQLLAGPIVYYKELVPQFQTQRFCSFHKNDIRIGIAIFSIGLFKKAVIADELLTIATPALVLVSDGQMISTIDAWVCSFLLGFRTYFDVSAYADMAIGISLFFGVRLPLNFNSPYKATSFIDFWKKWHITLTRFLIDYIFRITYRQVNKIIGRSQVVGYLVMLVTLLISGMWHGAAWTFAVWGLYHGILLIANYVWRRRIAAKFPRLSSSIMYLYLSRAFVTTAIILSLPLFYFDSLEFAFNFYKSLAISGQSVSHVAHAYSLTFVLVLVVFSSWADNSQSISGYQVQVSKVPTSTTYRLKDSDSRYNNNYFVIFIAITLSLGLMSISKPTPFIYFQF